MRKRSRALDPQRSAADKQANSVIAAMPPRIPDSVLELEEATQLLGYYLRDRGALRHPQIEMLTELVGAVPRLEDAPGWKLALKRVRADRIARSA